MQVKNRAIKHRYAFVAAPELAMDKGKVQVSENEQLPPANGKSHFPNDMTRMTPPLLAFVGD